jgi:hypothetical protein
MPPSPRYDSGGGPSIARQTDGETEERLRPSRSRRGSTAEGSGNTGSSGSRVSAEAFPEVPARHPQGFSGYLASHASRSRFGLSRPSGLAWTVSATAQP